MVWEMMEEMVVAGGGDGVGDDGGDGCHSGEDYRGDGCCRLRRWCGR